MRYSVLRSNYISRAQGVEMVVKDRQAPSLVEIRLPLTHDSAVADRQLREHLERVVSQPFDLARDQLLRAQLVHINTNDVLLLLCCHHIVGDEWSLGILAKDLADSYNALSSGHAVVSAPKPPDYSEYATWHRDWFLREREPIELAYWRKQLRGLEPISFVPDRLRPPQQSFRGARLCKQFEPRLVDALRRIGATVDATLAMVLLAALNVLLHRHTDSTDIGIGVPIANRNHAGSEGVVGTLLNTLVLRTNLDGNPSFLSLLESVRDSCLSAYEHQDMPFERLVQALQLPRDPSRAPLFGVMFNMLNTPPADLRFSGLDCSRVEVDRRAAQFDLTLTVDTEYDCSIVFEYATDLYSASTMERIASQYVSLLETLVESPRIRLSELPIISAGEREAVTAWGTGASTPIPAATLKELLEPSFNEFADNIAVVCAKESLSYAELDRQATILAGQLRARGFGRGALVGICLHRSTRTLISLLGVMRAGAAWVPLDASYPSERLGFMVQDAGLDLLITERAVAGHIPWRDEHTLCFDQLWNPNNETETANWDPKLDARPDDAAYVIYTSGSTGRPKGVVVPQRAVCNFLTSMAQKPGLGPADCLLAVTTLSFDIAVLEFLLPLLVGARVILAERPDLREGRRLRQLVKDYAVNIIQATPSTWRLLIDSGWDGGHGIRALVGGEPLHQDLATALLKRCAEVWNMYGPTETTIWSSCWRVDESALDGRISLGSPINNTQILVLDCYGNLCPVGVPGELCIGGAGLAVGYHRRPELDAERFVPDPFSNDPNVRLYRTGDLAKWLSDGTLQHLGRLDFQVKIRGHRIELGEIEAQLASHPQLAASVVIASEDRPGDTRLLAYSVPLNTMPPPGVLRAFLQERLPEYMVPQHFIELDAIPLLPNGKLNRAGLPAASAHVVSGAHSVEPRTSMERELWHLWRDVLGVDQFGIEDNFFDLGGHSMLAVRLMAKIRETFDRDVPLWRLFQNPTIAKFISALEAPEEPDEDTLVALQSDGGEPPLFCLCGIQLYQAFADEFLANRQVYGIFVKEELQLVEGLADQRAGRVEVPSLAAKYLAVIRKRQPIGPYHLVGLSFGGILAYEIAQQLRGLGDEVSLLAILDSNLPGRARDRLGFRIIRKLRKLASRSASRRSAVGRRTTETMAGEFRAKPLDDGRDRNYLDAIRNYRAVPYPGNAIFVEARLAAEYTSYGWSSLLPSAKFCSLDTDHLGLLKPPATRKLAALIKQELD